MYNKKAFAVFNFREGPLYTIITAAIITAAIITAAIITATIITTIINAAIVITNIKSTALQSCANLKYLKSKLQPGRNTKVTSASPFTSSRVKILSVYPSLLVNSQS